MNDISLDLPTWQDDFVSRLQHVSLHQASPPRGGELTVADTAACLDSLGRNSSTVGEVIVGSQSALRSHGSRLMSSLIEDTAEAALLPMTSAESKIHFTHPFRPVSLTSRPSSLLLSSTKLAYVCEYMISPRTIISSPPRVSRSPSPTDPSSPGTSPRYTCKDARCCGPRSPRGASGKGSSSQRCASGGGTGNNGRAQQNQTRRGNGRKASWRCSLHAVPESDEEAAVEV